MDNYDEAKRIANGVQSRYLVTVITWSCKIMAIPDNPTKWDMQVKINGYLEKLSKELDIPCAVIMRCALSGRMPTKIRMKYCYCRYGRVPERRKAYEPQNFELHVTDPKSL